MAWQSDPGGPRDRHAFGARRPAGAGSTAGLGDLLGRVATDLRISLTDRCNLRCLYCMPEDGGRRLPRADLLTNAEIVRLARVGVTQLGVDRIRLTGGEPLTHVDLPDIVAELAALRTHAGGPPEIALTTNGIGLDRHASALRRAGLRRVNVSLDTLDRDRYHALTRRDQLDAVLAGLAAAQAAGLRPVKVNTVVVRGVNEDDVVPLALFCLDRDYRLRFIERMPLDEGHTWDFSSVVPGAEILARLRDRFDLTPVPQRGSAPAEEWAVAAASDHPGGRIGLIASVTEPFCGTCDRTRLTADGRLRACLFTTEEVDLLTPLRAGAGDADLAELWRQAHRFKSPGHTIGLAGFRQPARGMSAIGG